MIKIFVIYIVINVIGNFLMKGPMKSSTTEIALPT